MRIDKNSDFEHKSTRPSATGDKIAHDPLNVPATRTIVRNLKKEMKRIKTEGDYQPDKIAHTPGPWINNGGQIEVAAFIGATFGERVIATVGVVNDQTRINTADARLIAAAPELLEACKAAKSIIDQFDISKEEPYDEDMPIVAQLRAAIAKAEGK